MSTASESRPTPDRNSTPKRRPPASTKESNGVKPHSPASTSPPTPALPPSAKRSQSPKISLKKNAVVKSVLVSNSPPISQPDSTLATTASTPNETENGKSGSPGSASARKGSPSMKSPIPSPVDKQVTRRRSMTTGGKEGRPIAGPDYRGYDETVRPVMHIQERVCRQQRPREDDVIWSQQLTHTQT